MTNYQSIQDLHSLSGVANTHKHRIQDSDEDFTSLDWVQDYLKDIQYKQNVQAQKGILGRLKRCLHYSQDWFLITIIAFVCATMAYAIDRCEELLVDLKRGYCANNVIYNEKRCCASFTCDSWRLWPEVFAGGNSWILRADFLVYIMLSLLLARLAVAITLTTKRMYPVVSASGVTVMKPMYTAYSSGLPEIKTILSGFTIKKFLGVHTLLCKSVALVFAIASGLSLGKEGPYVHLATCIGNICARLFKKARNNGAERRVMLSAAAAAGVTLAFGSPLGGVLFSAEEVSYFLPGNQLFKTFFCAIMSNLFLRMMDPYGTGKAVLFEVSYKSDWIYLEIILYAIIGIAGGLFGSLFSKFVSFWADWFRNKKGMSEYPIKEVLVVSGITALLTFANPYTNIAVPELLADIASPCYLPADYTGSDGLCPSDKTVFPPVIWPLLYALVVKIFLTSITFGIKVPAGIYVPTLVIGALFGRVFAMYFQYFVYTHPQSFIVRVIMSSSGNLNIDFGIYAMISAGAFMAGVTRMNITLTTIMFELTSSYNYVVPFSISIAISLFVANAIEPRSVYERLIQKNGFPFLNNRKPLNFSGSDIDLYDLFSIIDSTSANATSIDVTTNNYVYIDTLKSITKRMKQQGLLDGSIPVLKRNRLLFVLSVPKLESIFRDIEDFMFQNHVRGKLQIKLTNIDENTFQIINEDSDSSREKRFGNPHCSDGSTSEDSAGGLDYKGYQLLNGLCDLREIMDFSTIAVDIKSPLSLVEYIFTKLGNRTISIIDTGEFVGILHKKQFIQKCRNIEAF
ncbi:HCL675Wp [Eremothecium sinecaudum]|uniref:HCL675Wp n=1 Tax=Eremothecium sinecaudum TaxID=45286 RepID=A0A109UVT5_9SACH|nr:HCL675Wp [Eremothecium sinecaudum]AMD19476.1 HCL675Wp [Eremothecium sinecaudum]